MSINPLSYLPDLTDAVQDLLQSMNVDEEVIRETVAFLNGTAEALDEMPFEPLPESSFGASSNGGSMGHHTRLAHLYVIDSLADMVKTLTGTGERVKKFRDDMVFNDEDSQQQSRKLLTQFELLPPQADDRRQPRPTQEPS